LTAKRLLQKVFHRSRKAQPLDPLRPPLRRNLITRRPPNFLRIALEERQIKLPPKPVDQKIFKTLLRRNLAHLRFHVAHANAKRPCQPKISQRRRSQSNRIIKKLSQIIDPAL